MTIILKNILFILVGVGLFVVINVAITVIFVTALCYINHFVKSCVERAKIFFASFKEKLRESVLSFIAKPLVVAAILLALAVVLVLWMVLTKAADTRQIMQLCIGARTGVKQVCDPNSPTAGDEVEILRTTVKYMDSPLLANQPEINSRLAAIQIALKNVPNNKDETYYARVLDIGKDVNILCDHVEKLFYGQLTLSSFSTSSPPELLRDTNNWLLLSNNDVSDLAKSLSIKAARKAYKTNRKTFLLLSFASQNSETRQKIKSFLKDVELAESCIRKMPRGEDTAYLEFYAENQKSMAATLNAWLANNTKEVYMLTKESCSKAASAPTGPRSTPLPLELPGN